MIQVNSLGSGIVEFAISVENRPMNVISSEFIDQLEEVLGKELKNEKNKGFLFSSKRDEFIVGADIDLIFKENSRSKILQLSQRLQKIFRKIETSGRPFVALLSGSALGGGFELALACHRRLALRSSKIQFGLPEVKLGLLPGAGGTQRLPRLIGIKKSLPLLLEGKSLNPEKALEEGLIHKIFESTEEMRKEAIKWIEESPSPIAPWDGEKFKIPGGEIQSPVGYQFFPATSAMITEKTHHHYPAPRKILSAVYEGLQLPFDRAAEVEAHYFADLAVSKESKNLIRTLFFGINECNKGGHRPKDFPKGEFQKVGVLGAGMMGAGVAYVTALSKIPVVLKDISKEAVEKGRAVSEKILEKQLKRNKVSKEEVKETLTRIQTTTDPKDLKGCDLVIEAVIEDRKIKATVTQETEAVNDSNLVFASNTSTLPITSLAKKSSRPQNFIGLHFFSPVEKMPLVEIILGKETSDATLAKVFDYVRKIGKTPIIVNDGRGFFTSRVFTTYISEGLHLLKEGVPPALIENAGKAAGMPVGPLVVADEVSLDLIYHIMKQTKEDLGEEGVDSSVYEISSKFVLELKRLGKKSGAGFYDYPKGGEKHLSPLLGELFPVQDRDYDFEKIQRRILSIQALETYRCVEDGVLRSRTEADVGSILGWGFPAYTGGALSYIPYRGVDAFVDDCKQFEKECGSRFSIPDSLRSYFQ